MFISKLRGEGIHDIFHYLRLHINLYYFDKHDSRELPNSDVY